MTADELRQVLNLIPDDNPIDKARRREIIKQINALENEGAEK